MKTVERDENLVGKNLQQIKVSVKKTILIVYSELWFKFFLDRLYSLFFVDRSTKSV